MLLDIRLNVLKDVVDKFVVVEASYKHNGDKKNKNFNINKFSNFANKIDYFFVEQTPDNLYKISKNDSEFDNYVMKDPLGTIFVIRIKIKKI